MVLLLPLLEHSEVVVVLLVLQPECLMGDLGPVVPQLECLQVDWVLEVVQLVHLGIDLGDDVGNLLLNLLSLSLLLQLFYLSFSLHLAFTCTFTFTFHLCFLYRFCSWPYCFG